MAKAKLLIGKRTRPSVLLSRGSGSTVGQSQWTGSDGGHITVTYDMSLGQRGQQLAQDILARIDQMMAYNDQVFGVRGQTGSANVVPGNGGAYHLGCDFASGGDWYCDDMGASAPSPTDPGGIVFALVQAEAVESYMGVQAKGWDCGGSGGEALSRILAEIVSGGIRGAIGTSSGFSARSSYDGSDWISRDQGSDQDYPSIGCGMLYIDWMRFHGYTIQQIIQAGEPDGTLSSNYSALTGVHPTQAFADFKAAVSRVDISSDNPFGIPDSPYPLTPTPPVPPVPPVPPPVPSPGTLTLPATITINADGTWTQGYPTAAIPPILTGILGLLCGLAPLLPPGPIKAALVTLCGLLPHDAKK